MIIIMTTCPIRVAAAAAAAAGERPRLCCALFAVSRITIICQMVSSKVINHVAKYDDP